jgi:acetyltransferase-like isoleucine patch superfamily enzyme
MRKLAVRQNVIYQSDLHVGRRTIIMAPDRLVIGANVSIGINTWIAVNGEIEDGVLISSYVGIIGRYDHRLETRGQSPVDAPWIYDPAAKKPMRAIPFILSGMSGSVLVRFYCLAFVLDAVR